MKAGFDLRCMLTSQLIMVYSRMTKTVRSVEMKNISFWRLGYFFAANEHADRMA